MTTQHDRTRSTESRPRPARCLRHHVWLAACEDCREQHSGLLRARQNTSADR